MEATPPEIPPPGKEGALRGLSEPLLRYLEARGLLLTIEAQEALCQLFRLAVFASLAGTAAFTGWLLLTAGAVSVIMEQMAWSWQKAVTVLGSCHMFMALLFSIAVRNRLAQSKWFQETLNEFKKDRAWLARPTRKP